MYRSAVRSTPRAVNALRQNKLAATGRRFASTSLADKGRSWKSLALRTAVAIGAVYWYNTSSAFHEEIEPQTVSPPVQFSDDDLPTVEAVVEEKRRQAEARLAKVAASRESSNDMPPTSDVTTGATKQSQVDKFGDDDSSEKLGGPSELEAEADQQGAFNPETGEINWDCPCLGGMAHGPCGEEFKTAFSCFVYSNEEPKGMDCIEKFQHMQDCFRAHPDIYGEELADDEEAPADDAPAPEGERAAVESKASDPTPATVAPIEATDATGANDLANPIRANSLEQKSAKKPESK